jgi:primosomal protein N' (replication factor Y) (superfamily II helicase)
MEEYSTFVSVVLDLGFDKPLDYGVPNLMSPLIKRGMQVQAPLRGVLRTGYVVEVKKQTSFAKVLPLHSLCSEEELLTEEVFELALWMSRYYHSPLHQILKTVLPASIRHQTPHKEQYFVARAASKETLREACLQLRMKHPSQARVLDRLLLADKGIFLSELLEKADISRSPIESLEKQGLVRLEKIRCDRSPLIGEEYFKTQPKELNEAQKMALTSISEALEAKKFETHLLHGITGSGKTEVYLQAIEHALSLSCSAIMLVPEISLTAQTIERFRSRFDYKIAILHHRLSQGERTDEWHRIRRGDAQIVIGARSALFCPVRNLGMIIVDEEHDGAYKQSEESPCYNARDVAVMRGKMSQAVVVLGSATPSLESYFNAKSGKYKLATLPTRATQASLPRVHIVDMKKEHAKAGGFTSFSEILIDKMKERLKHGEQTILFLNRRGYNTSLNCKECGHIFHCPACDLTLTFHRGENTLSCHLCDFRSSPPPSRCPQCKKGEALKYHGIGTEAVERSVHALFPEARTMRIDGDTTKHKGSHEKLLRTFSTQKADILIGTQMVSKGLHFPAVTLVAALNCDSGLHIPDFRASERVFQQITQVAGRAGRGELPGEVIIQTQMPDNLTIQQASGHHFETFYASEIESRKMFEFPPFTHLVKLTFSGQDAGKTHLLAQKFCSRILLPTPYFLFPIVPSGYAKIKNMFRFQCLIRGPSVYTINHAIQQALTHIPLPRSIRLHIDVDPLSTYF